MTGRWPNHWRIVELADAMEAIIDYRGKSPRKVDSGIPLITARIVKNGRVETPEEFIAPDEYDEWMRRGSPEIGDVLLTTEAPLGEVAQLRDARVALAQRIITLRGKRGLVDNTFLKYLMQSTFVQDQLRSRSSGTTVLGIKQRELRKVELSLPPFAEQVAIGTTLGSLDEKIDLNHRLNALLEAMMSAVFKAWFIDFAPVKAKAAGAAAFRGMPDDVFGQFPGRFVESEFGQIPAGWEYVHIGELVKVVGGSTPTTKNPEFWGGEHTFCTPKDMSRLSSPVLLATERRITKCGVDQISSGQLPVGTVLLSSRAPIGYLAIAETPVSVNQGIIAMLTGDIPNIYILLWTKANIDAVKARAGGSTFAEISKHNFRPIPALRPPPAILSAFDSVVRPQYESTVNNLRENEVLTEMRAVMLPELLSGNVRVCP